MNENLQKPTINYPCEWEYRIICEDYELIKKLVFETISHEYRLKMGHISRNKRFVSVHLYVIVQNQKERDNIFATISADKSVKMVI